MIKKLVFLGIIFTALFAIAMGQQAVRNIPAKPNEEAQSFLRILSSPDLNERKKLFPEGATESDLKEKLFELQSKAGGAQKLVGQLFHYSLHAKSTREAMLPGFIIEQLRVSKDDQIRGLLPYLESDDEHVLKKAYNWLGGIDHLGYNRSTCKYDFDFNQYENIIRQNKSGVPQGLVKYMYTRSSDTALLTMENVYLERDAAEVLQREVNSKDEASLLNALSKRPEWWIQLYVAEKMEQEPKLRDLELIEQLKKSSHTIVREVVKEIEMSK